MKKIRHCAAIFAACAVFAAGPSGCRRQQAAPQPSSPVPTAQRTTNVQVFTVSPQEFTETVTSTGVAEPWKRVTVSPEIGGKVKRLHVDKGAQVAEGDLLLALDTDLLQSQLDAAQADYDFQKATNERSAQLFAKQAITRQQTIAAEAGFKAAQARLNAAKITLQKASVTSPLTGTVTNKFVEQGEFVAPGMPLFEIQTLNPVNIKLAVAEEDVRFISTGAPVQVCFDSMGDRRFEGVVSYVSRAADPATQGYPVEVRVENSGQAILPGYVARLRLVRQQFTGALVIPQTAILSRLEGKVAFVAEDGRARLRPITVGSTEGQRAMVTSGLSAGDHLIVTGQRDLVEGDQINVSSPTPAAGSGAPDAAQPAGQRACS